MKYIFSFVIIPLIIGFLIYLIWGKISLKMFDYIEKTNINFLLLMKQKFKYIVVPDFVKYNLPDLLWLYSFSNCIIFINKGINKNFYFYIPISLAIISEIFQYFGIINGTYDIVDICFYILGILLSILTFNFFYYENKKSFI